MPSVEDREEQRFLTMKGGEDSASGPPRGTQPTVGDTEKEKATKSELTLTNCKGGAGQLAGMEEHTALKMQVCILVCIYWKYYPHKSCLGICCEHTIMFL